MKRTLYNGQVILPHKIIRNGGVVINGGKITSIFEGSDFDKTDDLIDCKNNYIAPGFVDIHMHGGGGADALDGTVEAIETIASIHAKHGTTSIVPSLASASFDNMFKALDAIHEAKAKKVEGANILGAHLEGCYFSMAQKGAQNPKYIITPKKEEYDQLINRTGDVIMVSAAPEIEGGLEFGRDLSSRGIIMSTAHSDATYEEFVAGVEAGYRHVTHIYNGNSWLNHPYYYCQIGLCEAALLMDEVTVEAIADGKHIPPQLLKLLYKVKGADKMHVCTDSVSATGMPEGRYVFGGLETMVEDGVSMLPDRSSFAGSVCTGDRALRTLYKLADIPLVDAVKMFTATPSRVIKVYERKGSIAVGKDADINVFNDNIDILYTLIEGEVFNNNL